MIAAHAALAVTGSTGRLGSRVASGLSQLGVDQRLVVRNPAKAPSLPGTHVTTAEYEDRAAVRTALTGAHTVFMVSAAETADRVQQHLTFIDAAVDVGVQRIVLCPSSAPRQRRFTLARDLGNRGASALGRHCPYDLARQHLCRLHAALSWHRWEHPWTSGRRAGCARGPGRRC